MNSNLALRACFDRNQHTACVGLAEENVYVGFGANAIRIWRETKALEE